MLQWENKYFDADASTMKVKEATLEVGPIVSTVRILGDGVHITIGDTFRATFDSKVATIDTGKRFAANYLRDTLAGYVADLKKLGS
jgi:hypothetical protein